MIVSKAQYDNIATMRRQLLDTDAGRRTLCCQLVNMGLFQSADNMRRMLEEHPARMHNVVAAIGLLEGLAIWNEDNFLRILGMMAQLPLPNQKENERG